MTATLTGRVQLGFTADSAAEAVEKAKAWARAEGLRVRTVCSVRYTQGQTWRVELSVRPAGSAKT